ncbi:MAG: tryptophan synthase subunit alpha [Spirochaetales bacterium]|nr:tryptophan synthase subunit alpha [Spirochaetales bacterium]
MNQSTFASLMVHMIPFFPDLPSSQAVARGIVRAGADHIEIQFPFSDPSADGPTIEAACNRALAQGFRVSKGFDFVREVANLPGSRTRVHIMTYASLVYARGVQKFCADAAEAGAWGLIIPDLPTDNDEGLREAAQAQGLHVVPVVVPTTTDSRLDLITSTSPSMVYGALRTGITGTKTELGPENEAFIQRILSRLRPYGGQLAVGFGIQERAQVRALQPLVDSVIVGSALVRAIGNPPATSEKELEERVANFVTRLATD